MAYTIWTTGACNLKCKYCYEGLDKPSLYMTSSVAEETLKFIIYDSKKDDELLINFHGGEPFLNFKIIQYFVTQLKEYYMGKKEVVFTVTVTKSRRGGLGNKMDILLLITYCLYDIMIQIW